jgi:septum formation protein
LADEKAKKIAFDHPQAFVIGSDQTAHLDNLQIKKPINFEEAFKQLKKLSSQEVKFFSAVVLFNLSQDIRHAWVEEISVKYKKLDDKAIENYLNFDKPYGCLGCIKSEGLGISLLDKVSSNDPTAIIGLPLIALSDMLIKNKIKLRDAK